MSTKMKKIPLATITAMTDEQIESLISPKRQSDFEKFFQLELKVQLLRENLPHHDGNSIVAWTEMSRVCAAKANQIKSKYKNDDSNKISH